MVGDRPTRSRAPANYKEDRPLEEIANAGIYGDPPRASISGSSRNGREPSASGPKLKFKMPTPTNRLPSASEEYPEQDDEESNDDEQPSDDDFVKDSEYEEDKPTMNRPLRSRAPLPSTNASSSSHQPDARRTRINNGNHLNAAPHPSNNIDLSSLSRASRRPSSSSGRTTRNSAQQIKSEEFSYHNVDGQGRSQAQLQSQIDPSLHDDGDGEYVGEPEGDDDADASGEPDYGDDEEADPMNLQPGGVLDGGIVPPLTASQEDAEGEDEDEVELSECLRFLVSIGASWVWLVWLGQRLVSEKHDQTTRRTTKKKNHSLGSSGDHISFNCSQTQRNWTFSTDIKSNPTRIVQIARFGDRRGNDRR